MAKAKFNPIYRRLRRLLVNARKKAGLNQTDVAKQLERPQSYVSKVESGERRLDVGEFVEFASAIKSDPIRLLRKAIDAAEGE
nr:helix-turn-helix transcriptional regulator [Nitrosomonas nitrosa]